MFGFSDEDTGVRNSELVNWYLKEMEAEIDTEAELMEKKTLVEKVIYRLIHHVSGGHRTLLACSNVESITSGQFKLRFCLWSCQ